MAETRRYPFQKPRGALVLLCASATRNETTGEWEGEPGQLKSLATIREQCIERGFTVIEELGTSSSAVGKPTANDIHQLVRRLSERDFSENDALMMVIGSHGYEGHIRAWPNAGEDETSGPVALRDEIFSLFQPALHGTGTKASQTLVGKPKIFLIDACRSPKGAEGTLTHVEHPLRPAVGPEAKGVFDGLQKGQKYTPPVAPDGTTVTRYSDFCFGYATVPFNEAGLLADATTGRSLFLSALAEQLRDHPHGAFVHQFAAANDKMQRQYGKKGQVKVSCFPQCAELVCNTLRKALYFDAPDRDLVELIEAAQHASQDNPEVAALLRKMTQDAKLLKELQRKAIAKRANRTRSLEDVESPAFDTSALMASVTRIAQLLGGSNALAGPAGEAVQAACARLGQQVDGNTWTARLEPVRRELDALAQLQFELPPRLTLLAPAEVQQRLSRDAVRRDIAFDDDDDDDDARGAQPAQPSSAARRWTSVPVGEKLHLQMHCQQKGYCYMFHLNEEDELSVVFPNKKDTENLVPEANHNLYVPGRFADGPKAQYLRFTGSHLQRETFYLLTINKRLEDFETVGALPMDLKKLEPRQAQAVLATLRRAAGGAATRGATFRALDADFFNELDDDEDGSLSMALSTMTLISVGSAE